MNLQEIIDIEFLQKVQDTFAKATGFAAVTVDFRGNPITDYSNFSPFCRLVRQEPQLVDSCLKCDAFGGLEAARKEKPHVYHCHTGLVDFAIPIIVKGQLVGSVLAGQVKLPEHDDSRLTSITNDRSSWEGHKEIERAYANIPAIPYEKINAAAEMMFYVINNMFEKDMMHFMQEELNAKNEQIINQLKVQADLKKALTEKQNESSHPLIDPHFLLTAMNTLSCLAIIEKAPQTQDTILTLAEMIRYMITNKDEFVPLKEELHYIEQYVRLQNLRFNGRLQVLTDIREEDRSTSIPSGTLYSIVNEAVQSGIEPKAGKGTILITGYQAGNDFLLEVSSEGMNVSNEQPTHVLEAAHDGQAYPLAGHSRLEGGTAVKVSIPMSGR
ncbi:PocR ligand-binding domain-containing protein [Bacillus thermotolerans]|uniref:Histidine kinase n=1 Tax=Bacillus thermotolerans TaxID=1221996 RepID=A0A0F5HMP8_BACTR|nr:PocR ligand-binding domain-containing protein [Bacillus thermotolerans]KKB34528.1 hypothetical protein QY95_03879 [Bacillus thermotolerans]